MQPQPLLPQVMMAPSINHRSKLIANHAGAVKPNISHAGSIPAVVFVI
ncbi:hypothetical protein BN934_01715 [Lacticaseibacillus rhamnosus]|nr:hypothetical protein BN934_01715 [Lacticaseibacillus rhamnosus]